MSDDYTVEDWIELENRIDFLEEYYEIHSSEMKHMRDASAFIKETLGIKTEPIVAQSLTTKQWYYTNIYTDVKGLITTYSKRSATDKEIEKALERMKNE